MKILITGAAGFIGFSLIEQLVKENNYEIVGLDNINNYYNTELKYSRLAHSGIEKSAANSEHCVQSKLYPQYRFIMSDICDFDSLEKLFAHEKFDVVIHLAAQAGVRYSIKNPQSYIRSNIEGFTNILECCRHNEIKHLIYASSSSVYGVNNAVPFKESDNVDFPISLYAATKRSNELTAYTYSHLFQLPTTGLRLFSVYGPWGRPDMAPMLFAKSIYEQQPIKVYNNGDMFRDFTFIKDTISGITGLINKAPDKHAETPFYKIFNIGNSQSVKLLDFINILEHEIGINACVEMLPIPLGDVVRTCADTSQISNYTSYDSKVDINSGVHQFVDWYKDFRIRCPQCLA